MDGQALGFGLGPQAADVDPLRRLIKKGLAPQLPQTDHRPAMERVGGTGRQIALGLEQKVLGDFGLELFRGEADQGVHPGGEQMVELLVRRVGADRDLGFGPGLVQLLDQRMVDGVPQGHDGGQLEHQFVSVDKGLHRVAGFQVLAVEAAGRPQKSQPRRGQPDVGGVPLEQLHLQLFFQAADLVAQGGLGDEKLPGCAGKIQGPADYQKTEQLTVVHGGVPPVSCWPEYTTTGVGYKDCL